MTSLPPELDVEQLLRRAWSDAWLPPARISMPAWADKERRLKKGPWITERFEISRGPMLAVTEKGVHEISIMCCTQLMKTEFILNGVGYLLHLDPCDILLLQPKDEAAEQFSKERLQPMFRLTPALRALLLSAEETLTYKPVPGGFVALAGAGSPDNVARRPIRAVFADEIDKYRFTREGNTLLLAKERTAQEGGLNWLVVQACSPTVEGESLIADCYYGTGDDDPGSDRRLASVECPHCGHRQFLDFFKHVNWPKLEDANGRVVRHLTDRARIHCEACGAGWSEGERLRALGTIRWHQTRPFECCGERHVPLDVYERAWKDGAEDPAAAAWDWWEDTDEGRWAVYRARCPTCGAWGVDNLHAGFQASKLYSPSQKDKPSDIARKWMKAKGKPDDELVWWNTQMGLPHKPNSGKVLDVDKLLARRETWAGPVPDGTGALTFGADIQDYRVEIEIVAWGRDEESWSVQYHVIDGEFSDPLVRKKVDEFLLGTWYDQHGRPYRLDGGCMDSGGHHTQAVYEFCKARLGRYIWAIKGASERDGARNPVWPTKRPSRRTKASFRPVVIGGNAARDTIRGRLLLEPPPPGGARPGYCHFPADRDIGYFQQLTADRLELKEVSGRKFTVWVTPPGRANEAADCRVYAYAGLCGLQHMGLQLNRAVERRAAAATPAQLGVAPEIAVQPGGPPQQAVGVAITQAPAVVVGEKKSLGARLA